MPTIPTRDLGSVGIVKDVAPTALPANAWSDGINVRFNDGKVQRSPVFRNYFTGLSGIFPVWCYGRYNPGGFDSLIYANNDGRVFEIANGVETNITELGHTNNVDPRRFTGTTLANCIYINRPDAPPRVLTATATQLVNIPGWDATWNCVALRSFKSFLIAMNMVKGGTFYPTLVKWSDVASNNAAPTSWDATDTTKLAGENVLTQATTPIVDGGPLGDNFIIYTYDEVWKMVYDPGGQFIFDFYRLPFDNAGLINQNCWVEIDGKHYAWSDTDIYVHDGIQKTSIIDQRNRKAFFGDMNQQAVSSCFVAHDKYHNEILFCCVSGNTNARVVNPNGGCNYAAVYNYRNNTWSFRDLPNVSFASTANANTVYTWGTVPANLSWGNTGGSWYDQQDSFSRFAVFTILQDTANGITTQRIDVLDLADTGKLALTLDSEAPVNPNGWVERTGLALDAEGSDLRAYKVVRSVLPEAALYSPDATLEVQVGNHNMTGQLVSWDPAVTFDPATDYKVDSRRGGRYIGTRFTIATPNDFDLSGYDMDVTITGRR